MLQNESVDEDLEHFEDIAEEEEDQANMTQNRTNNVDKVVRRNDCNSTGSDSSGDQGDPAASDSEDGDVDERSLFVTDGLNNLTESKPVFELQEQESEAKPGGYNPRHREPSFWYLLILDGCV